MFKLEFERRYEILEKSDTTKVDVQAVGLLFFLGIIETKRESVYLF